MLQKYCPFFHTFLHFQFSLSSQHLLFRFWPVFFLSFFYYAPFSSRAYIFTLKMPAQISLEMLTPKYQHASRDVKKATTLFWLHYTMLLWHHSPFLKKLWHCHLTTMFFGKYDNVWNVTTIQIGVTNAGRCCLVHVVPNTSQPLVKTLQ